ncbi:hypothetical protein [Halorientalis salina]|uniref:hypothetical protein n=1 Tax=Halorientalis salina TaxID=2932266 RepID=UPI0010AD7E46|nr:hypothetical protein [Halorientalis salina]
MPDCNYCEESFADEEAYLEHLHAAHDEGELSRIDRRRVEQEVGYEEDGGLPTGPLIIGGLLLFTMGVLVYVTFFVWGGSGTASGPMADVAQTPTNVGDAHEHGKINVTIDGQTLDFSQARFQNPQESPAFHFEGGDGSAWHVHAEGVTLEYGMATLGIDVNRTAVTYQDTTYRDSDPNTNVIVQVNNESVNPATYELSGVDSATGQGGDFVRIIVETNVSESN